jgi:hypothetical protein
VTTLVALPLAIGTRGRTAIADPDAHIRQMIEHLLFTSAGERVNRPDFGSGLLQLVFAGASSELAAALQFGMQAALQQWLGDIIDIRTLEVEVEDATVRIDVGYVVRRTTESGTTTIRAEVPR